MATAKNRMQRELRNAGKERGQITAHRQTSAKPGNDAADHGLHNADAAFGMRNLTLLAHSAAAKQPPNMPMIIIPSMRVSGVPSRWISLK